MALLVKTCHCRQRHSVSYRQILWWQPYDADSGKCIHSHPSEAGVEVGRFEIVGLRLREGLGHEAVFTVAGMRNHLAVVFRLD